ncbi:hypothetical protein POX_f07838 [Penicillium oxalicum]|uniref:hypothetical protein n=1 Tax=Penicillium oxalicum TaxID=69781 RepID=UPI0020B6980D|nr:hypothetical protein POX_f07838 [Penicillium oxalicum]KAI2787473.1 hypothetical protein POX_f07838 [Penicillium oxalicum]
MTGSTLSPSTLSLHSRLLCNDVRVSEYSGSRIVNTGLVRFFFVHVRGDSVSISLYSRTVRLLGMMGLETFGSRE